MMVKKGCENMKKICFSIECINVCGGTERVTTQLANALSNKYDVSILSYEIMGSEIFFEIDKNVNVDYLFQYRVDENLKKYYFKIVYRLRKYLIKNKIDVLVVVDVNQLLFVSLVTIGLNIKIIAWEQFNSKTALESKNASLARWIAAKKCDAIVTLTKEDCENYKNEFSPKANVRCIYNPLTPALLAKKEKNSKKTNTILTIGRLQYQKGYDMLIEVADILFNEFNVQGWKWLIVGDGIEKKWIENKIEELNLKNKVIMEGEKSDVSTYLNQAKLFVLTSRYEGFGLVIVEAQYFNLPVVSFDCNMGPSELILDDKNGYLVPCFDIRKMAESIYQLIRNESRLKDFSDRATENIHNFEFKPILEQWEELVNSLEGE